METCAGSRLILGEFREDAVIAAAKESLAECGGQPTCGFLFLAASWLPQIHEILDLVRLHGRIPLLIGSIGAGLIGRSQEAEGSLGMSLLLVSLPETKLTPVLISNEQIEEIDWARLLADGDRYRTRGRRFMDRSPTLHAAPRTLAGGMERCFPDAPSFGGISSGATEIGENTLLLDGKAIDAAVLALAVKGGKIRTIVSQGCKPVGEPFTITQADENLIYALGSRPAYQVLSETFNGLSDDEKERARGNLFAGLAASEYVAELKRGDFLVRNLLGADPQTGPSRSARGLGLDKLCNTNSGTKSRPMRTWSSWPGSTTCAAASRLPPSSFPATAAVIASSACPITMPRRSPRFSDQFRARDFSVAAKSARLAMPATCTATPPRSHSSASNSGVLPGKSTGLLARRFCEQDARSMQQAECLCYARG